MKEHPVYTGYLVTEDGRVFSAKKKEIKKQRGFSYYLDYNDPKEIIRTIGTNGYYMVSICFDGKQITKTIHSLVAETFIENPENLPQINHIDENKLNNNINNLEWVTPQKNSEHSLSKIYVIENIKTGEKITIFNLRRWCRENNINLGNIRETMTGKRFQCQGYRIIEKREKE